MDIYELYECGESFEDFSLETKIGIFDSAKDVYDYINKKGTMYYSFSDDVRGNIIASEEVFNDDIVNKNYYHYILFVPDLVSDCDILLMFGDKIYTPSEYQKSKIKKYAILKTETKKIK